MSLRTTTLLIIVSIFIGLVALLVFNLQSNLSAHFSRLEQQNAALMLERARGIFNLEMETLNLIAQEWSRRTDVAAFVESNGATPAPALLAGDCTADNLLTVAILVDSQARISEVETCQGASLAGLDAAFPTHLASRSGFLKLPGGPVLLSGAPVGTTGAWVFAGRQVNNDLIARINSSFDISAAVFAVDADNLPAEVHSAVLTLNQKQTSATVPVDENNLSSFMLFDDIYGQPAYVLQIVQPRITYYSGQLVTNYLMIFLVTSSFIFGLIIIFLLERLILSRVTQLSREVNQIGQSGDFSHRVTLHYNDELTRLGKGINSMLAELNQRMQELQTLYDASQELMGKLNTGTILSGVCEFAVQKMDLASAWIGQIKTDDAVLVATAASGCDLKDLPALPVDCGRADQSPACQVYCQEKAVFQPSGGAQGAPASTAALPLHIGSETAAVLVLNSSAEDYFTPSRQSQLLAFTNQASLALQSARYYEEAKITQRRLEVLSHRLVQIQEEERRRIAQELHDEIGQKLTGLRIMLGIGVKQPEKLSEASLLVNELIGHVRQISLDLRPAMLDDLGLLPALVWLFGRYTRQTGVQVNFTHAHLEDRRFSSEIEITAYRVVQESLTNVARYARVTTAVVRVWVTPTDLMLQIKDLGVGFDFDPIIRQREGQGLLGMRERVNFVGGNLYIETRPGQGTSISAKLPIYPDSEAL